MSSGCCELIKTKRVMCEEQFTITDDYTFCPIRIPNDNGFTAITEVTGTSNILCTGCDLSIDPLSCTITVTISGFLLDETLTITGTGGTDPSIEVEIPVARICDTIGPLDLNKCKMTNACKENLECQVFNLTAENTVDATIEGTAPNDEIVITQTISNISFTIKIDQEVQLLVQLCSKTGGKVTINPT